MEPESGWRDLALDGVQAGLGLVGFIPGYGEAADLLDGAISLGRGDYPGAALSMASCVPMAGVVPGAVKVVRALGRVDDGVDASRGVSRAGGIFTTTENAAGGRVITAVGDITQTDVATHVNSALMQGGNVRILSGAHGTPTGEIIPEASFFADDVARFGQYPGVTVNDVTTMTPAEITGALESPGTTIGAFCNSGPCLGIK
jgi:hypothetical protein